MKIVKIMGGLGNQMFQYAFGKVIGANAYDISWFKKVKHMSGVTKREYELDFWDIKPKLLKNSKLFGIFKRHRIVEKPTNVYSEILLNNKNGVFDGYFQVAKYYDCIRDELLKDFVPKNKPSDKNKKTLDLIKSVNSVSIHVRRGDYVNLQHVHGLCDIDYYKRAIDFISKKHKDLHFFVFSDDMEYVKKNLKIKFPCEYIDFNHGRDSAWDIVLMSNCKHNIIANSSFSWWGAWLNQNKDKIVIAPKQWFADGKKTDIIPENWERI